MIFFRGYIPDWNLVELHEVALLFSSERWRWENPSKNMQILFELERFYIFYITSQADMKAQGIMSLVAFTRPELNMWRLFCYSIYSQTASCCALIHAWESHHHNEVRGRLRYVCLFFRFLFSFPFFSLKYFFFFLQELSNEIGRAAP